MNGYNAPQRLRGIVALVRILLAKVGQTLLCSLMIERPQILSIQVQRGFRPNMLSKALGIDAGAKRRVMLYQLPQPGFQPCQIQPQAVIFAKVVHCHAAERPLFAAAE
ncbi:hypothetical protein D3C75_743480 [compost metagenome]